MVRPVISLLIALICLLGPLPGRAGGLECVPVQVNRLVAPQRAETLKIAATKYEQAIETKLGSLDVADADRLTTEVLEQMRELNPAFPREEFSSWLKQNPFSPEELKPGSTKTFGEVFRKKALAYEKSHPSFDVAQFTEETSAFLKTLEKTCGVSRSCRDSHIRAFATSRLKKAACLFRNPAALRNVITSILFYDSGLLIAHGKSGRPAKDFPYDLFLTQLIWTPILTEVGCRNLEKSVQAAGKPIPLHQPVEIARTVAAPPSFTSTLGKQYVTILRCVPLVDTTYMGLHIGLEKLRGHEVDLSARALGEQFLTLVAWDLVAGAPRVAATNILFNDKFPNHLRPYLNRHIQNRTLNELAYTGADLGARFMIFGGNAALQSWYLPFAQDFWKSLHGEKPRENK